MIAEFAPGLLRRFAPRNDGLTPPADDDNEHTFWRGTPPFSLPLALAPVQEGEPLEQMHVLLVL
jgi:hypothetical protein